MDGRHRGAGTVTYQANETHKWFTGPSQDIEEEEWDDLAGTDDDDDSPVTVTYQANETHEWFTGPSQDIEEEEWDDLAGTDDDEL